MNDRVCDRDPDGLPVGDTVGREGVAVIKMWRGQIISSTLARVMKKQYMHHSQF